MKISELHTEPNNKVYKPFYEILNTKISFSIVSIPFSEQRKEQFYSELSALLESGLDLRSALDIFISNLKNKKLVETFNNVQTEIIKGIALSKAMQNQKLISDYEFYSLEIGEESGKTIQILRELGVYFQNKIKQRQLITKALSYPIVVSVTAVLAIVFMLTFVVPLFAGIFQRMGQDLPAITKFILSLSNFFTDHILTLALALTLLIIIIQLIRKKLWFKSVLSSILLKIPFLGNYILKIHLIRFCNSMALLISSGVNIVRSLDLLSKMIRFYPLQKVMPEIKDEIIKGKRFHETLSSYSIFPGKMIALLKVGEEVNKLDEFFSKISDQYEKELETQSSILVSVLELIILVFLGTVVAFILIAMYLPLFDLNRLF